MKDCIVCRATGIYYMGSNFTDPRPCHYCEGTGKVEEPEYRFHFWAERVEKREVASDGLGHDAR